MFRGLTFLGHSVYISFAHEKIAVKLSVQESEVKKRAHTKQDRTFVSHAAETANGGLLGKLNESSSLASMVTRPVRSSRPSYHTKTHRFDKTYAMFSAAHDCR